MIRYVDATPTGDAWELHALVSGDWRVINAGLPSDPVGGRFPTGSVSYRLLNVWHNGRTEVTDPQPLDAKHVGPVRRKFSRDDVAWLEANGVDPHLAATFPRGHSLADIKDALSE